MAEIPFDVITAFEPIAKYVTALDSRPMTEQEIGIVRFMFESVPEKYRGWCSNMLRLDVLHAKA